MLVRFEDCEVDFDRVEIRNGGSLVAVEPQVFDVLSYLIEHRDRLVTKEELLDNVWGDRFVSESALTSRIKSARQAIGDSGRDQRLIKTVHGRGYRFVADVDPVDRAGRSEGVDTAAAHPPLVPDGLGTDVHDGANDGHRDGWPFVGRHELVEQMIGWLDDGSYGGAVVTGPAGIGKTRVAIAFAERARAIGWQTIRIDGHVESSSIPLATLGHVLPVGVLELDSLSGDLARAAVFQRARVALRAIGRTQPTVLLVDNAGLIDELTISLIGSLAAERSIFPLLTHRVHDGETPLLADLIRNGDLGQLAVGPLDDAQVDVLLYRVLAGPIDVGSLDLLTQLCRGRPGALRQLVESCRVDGTLTVDEGVWRLIGSPPAVAVAPGGEPFLIDELEPAVLAGAELLAIAHELDLDVALDLLDADVVDRLDELRLLAVDDVGRGAARVSVTPTHLAQLIRDRVGPLRRRRCQQRLLDALDGRDRSADDGVRLASWAVALGTPIDRDEVLAAAHRATIADDQADALLDHLHTTAPGPDVDVLRAELAFRRNQVDRADRLMADVLAADPPAAVRAAAIRRRATIAFFQRGEHERALSDLLAAGADLDGPDHALVEAHRIGLMGVIGFADQVVDAAGRLPDDLDDGPAAEVARAMAQACFLRGRFSEAIDHVAVHRRRSAERADRFARPVDELADSVELACLAARGEVTRARELMQRVRPVGQRMVFPWLPITTARIELLARRPRVARDRLTGPLFTARSQDRRDAEPLLLGLLAQTMSRTGEIERAVTLANTTATSIPGLIGWLRWTLAVSLAEVWRRGGQADRARTIALEQLEDAWSHGAAVTAMDLALSTALAGGADDVADRIDDIIAGIEGPIGPVCARTIHAIADGRVAPDEIAEIVDLTDAVERFGLSPV